LRGYRRAWQVAMDNTRDLPGYKHYLDPDTGERPAIYVAYVDLEPDPEHSTEGVVFPVDPPTLEALDLRERNYERREVQVDPAPEGVVWAYFGTREARERFARGIGTGTAVVDRDYYERVNYPSTDPPPVPIRHLIRIDAPLAKGTPNP
jgi:gamma-glutamylcyclotransferase (GGCT)/AIG2-like uncharacterized protein YtfP